MSKRVNNKRGNRVSKRSPARTTPTKVRGGGTYQASAARGYLAFERLARAL